MFAALGPRLRAQDVVDGVNPSLGEPAEFPVFGAPKVKQDVVNSHSPVAPDEKTLSLEIPKQTSGILRILIEEPSGLLLGFLLKRFVVLVGRQGGP